MYFFLVREIATIHEQARFETSPVHSVGHEDVWLRCHGKQFLPTYPVSC